MLNHWASIVDCEAHHLSFIAWWMQYASFFYHFGINNTNTTQWFLVFITAIDIK